MQRETLGKMIYCQRKQRQIKAEDLAKGVCTTATIQRMERGERLPDYFVLERIVERLGSSINKLEFLYDENSYNIICLREQIEQCIMHGLFCDAEKLLLEYENYREGTEPLHLQYIYKYRAVIDEKFYHDSEKSLKNIELAMNQTMHLNRLEDLREYVLGEEEIILVLMWLKLRADIEKTDISGYSGVVTNYIEYNYRDEEVRANVYTKAAWLFAKEYIKRENYSAAYELCKRGIDLLTDNGMLLHLPQLIKFRIICEEHLKKESCAKWSRMYDSLMKIYAEYGQEYMPESEISIWENYRQTDTFLISELVGQERKAVNLSQEKLAENLDMDYKTISRIETGKYKPKKTTFDSLKKYLSINLDICSTRIVTDDFALLELERKIARYGHEKNFEKMEDAYQKIKDYLNEDYAENKQYILYMDTFLDRLHNRITIEESLERCIEALKITKKQLKWENINFTALSKMEVTILNNIALMYDYQGKKKEAIFLRESMLKSFLNSKVKEEYHYASIALLVQNLCISYLQENRLDEAVEMCEYGIRFCLKCKKGSQLGDYRMRKTYAEEKKGAEKEACREIYRQAYDILVLMKRNSLVNVLEKHYFERYGERLN